MFDTPEMCSAGVQRRPGNGGSAKANLSWGQNASVMCVIPRSRGLLALKLQVSRSPKGFCHLGTSLLLAATMWCPPTHSQDSPSSAPMRPQGRRHGCPWGTGPASVGTAARAKPSTAARPCRRSPVGYTQSGAEELRCLFPVPPICFGWWDAPGAGVGCTPCRRNPETLSCCKNILAQAT